MSNILRDTSKPETHKRESDNNRSANMRARIKGALQSQRIKQVNIVKNMNPE